MAQLQCKTLGDVSPRGKARVYFACHPEDHKGFFQEIREDLQKYSNCAVYYYDEEPERDEEYYANLERMQLFVMPVTTRLLYQPNRAMDVEFAYAMEHHIPVLPLMQEPGLEEKYAERFGNLQYLDKGNRDLTAIPYEEKLKKYLDAVLLNDEMTAQVRAAFDAWIFLSYRKKDRKAAQELMRLIHNDPRCRDIAIWYDEFLNPGEDFSEAIRKALAESQLFVLAVTPNLLEKGNYVMREEYPEARKAGKPILPAEMEQTDRNALREGFPGVPDLLDSGADGVVTGAVLDALSALAIRENDEDPRHNFFIGLAYLSGLYVEKDHPRAVKLITQSAEADLTEAMEKLVTMYETGEGVERDYKTAIQWRERLVEQAKKMYVADGTDEAAENYCNRMKELAKSWRALRDLNAAKQVYQKLYLFANHSFRESAKKWNKSAVWVSCVALVSICLEKDNVKEAEKWFLKSSKLLMGTVFEEFGQDGRKELRYNDLAGMLHMRMGYPNKAKKCYLDALEIAQKQIKKGTPESISDLMICHIKLGDICEEEKDLAEAKLWYERALETGQKLAETGAVQAQHNLAICYERLGGICKQEKNCTDAKLWYTKHMDIAQELTETGAVDAQWMLARSYSNMGGVYKAESNTYEARQWYMKALSVVQSMSQLAEEELLLRKTSCYLSLAEIDELENPIEARWRYLQVLDICESLPEPQSAQNIKVQAAAHIGIGRIDGNTEGLEKASQLYKKLVQSYPGVSRNRVLYVALLIHIWKLKIENSTIWKRIFRRKKEK